MCIRDRVVPAGTVPFVPLTGVTINPAPLHTVKVIAVIAGFGLTAMVLLAVAVPHDPPMVVSVRVAVPLYVPGGVHVALRIVPCGLNVPPAVVDPIPPVAEPPTLPTKACLLYTSPSPRDRTRSRMPSS